LAVINSTALSGSANALSGTANVVTTKLTAWFQIRGGWFGTIRNDRTGGQWIITAIDCPASSLKEGMTVSFRSRPSGDFRWQDTADQVRPYEASQSQAQQPSNQNRKRHNRKFLSRNMSRKSYTVKFGEESWKVIKKWRLPKSYRPNSGYSGYSLECGLLCPIGHGVIFPRDRF
jgi:hypothetical protein